MTLQQFGGPWTEKKLKALESYLEAYLTIFTRNPQAAQFTRHYVDAFAGSGLRSPRNEMEGHLDFEDTVNEAMAFMDGSVRKVLALEPDFHHYWFVEKDAEHAESLRKMIKRDFAERKSRCHIREEDANEFLLQWCENLDAMDRAVVFLDPYGVDVHWATIETLAATQKVDLWMLFPSSSVLRMLPKAGPPDEAWSRRLTELFGDESWRQEFYREVETDDLFGSHKETKREVTTETVAEFLLGKLWKIFADVADSPLVLYNSRRSPLFMLVFAAGNPKGAPTAIRIAKHIISGE